MRTFLAVLAVALASAVAYAAHPKADIISVHLRDNDNILTVTVETRQSGADYWGQVVLMVEVVDKFGKHYFGRAVYPMAGKRGGTVIQSHTWNFTANMQSIDTPKVVAHCTRYYDKADAKTVLDERKKGVKDVDAWVTANAQSSRLPLAASGGFYRLR